MRVKRVQWVPETTHLAGKDSSMQNNGAYQAESGDWYVPGVGRVCSECKVNALRSDNQSGFCQKYKECNLARQRKQKTDKRAQGKCTRSTSCPNPINTDRSTWYCTEHLDEMKDEYNDRRAQGKCDRAVVTTRSTRAGAHGSAPNIWTQ